MESVLAVTDFVNEHKLTKDSFGHCEFRGFVEYTSCLRNTFEITTIKFVRNGYNDGDIQLTESGELNSDDFHLDFSTDYQKYAFNTADSSLVISGSSRKMGGKYHVTLKPL